MRTRTTIICLLSVTIALPGRADAEWTEAAQVDGITIWNRRHPGSEIAEVRAVGHIDAPAWVVKNVIDDVARYKDFMPYTKSSDVITRGAGYLISYQQIEAPLIANRDYVIRIDEESSTTPSGKAIYNSRWHPAPAGVGPKPVAGVVRILTNEGYWRLVDAHGAQGTLAEYFVHTDPSGSLPAFIINAANHQAIPGLFRAVRSASRDARYRIQKPQRPSPETRRVEIPLPAREDAVVDDPAPHR